MAIRLYTDEEIQEILQWYNDNAHLIPSSLKLDKAVTIKDLPFTLKRLKYIAENYNNKISFKGEIELLFTIRNIITQNAS